MGNLYAIECVFDDDANHGNGNVIKVTRFFCFFCTLLPSCHTDFRGNTTLNCFDSGVDGRRSFLFRENFP